ncbi:hypothetical protein DFH09DRAFT_1072500 [Mycena vulgaris]|nr:hypothetical protein DFH09DRAFT_1072500 [Mycena vulgaris]
MKRTPRGHTEAPSSNDQRESVAVRATSIATANAHVLVATTECARALATGNVGASSDETWSPQSMTNQSKSYNCGIGTCVPPEAKTSLKHWRQKIDNFLDLAFAWNFKDVILKAYQWLSQTYQRGDRIYFFGFSRGAYQVRTLAGMIETVELVHPGNEELSPLSESLPHITGSHVAGNAFQHVIPSRRDTVSSVGVFRGNPLPLTSSSRHIYTFRHALALDERRVKFLPEYVDGGSSTIDGSAESGNPVNVKEVWFAELSAVIKMCLRWVFRGVNHPEDALYIDEEAVRLGRKLAETDPTVTADLADTLQNLALDLIAVSRHKDALCMKRFLDFAASSGTIAVGYHETALDHTEEAVRIGRDLAKADLQPQSVHLNFVGRHEDALQLAREAVETCRRAADADPAAMEDLAISLQSSEEAVEILRRLAEQSPTASKDLSRALQYLEVDLSDVGRYEDAIARYLVGELCSFGNHLQIVGRHDVASALTEELTFNASLRIRTPSFLLVHAREEAVEICEKLPERNVLIQLSLASAPRSLAASLRAMGRHEDAAPSYEKGALIYSKLAETDPKDTAYSLHELAVDFRSIGLHDDAVRAEADTVELYRKLVQAKPALAMPLVMCLGFLAEDLRTLE